MIAYAKSVGTNQSHVGGRFDETPVFERQPLLTASKTTAVHTIMLCRSLGRLPCINDVRLETQIPGQNGAASRLGLVRLARCIDKARFNGNTQICMDTIVQIIKVRVSCVAAS